MFTPLKASDNYNDNPLSFPFLGRNGFPTTCWPSPSGRPPAAVATQLWRWSFGGILEGSVFSAPPEKWCSWILYHFLYGWFQPLRNSSCHQRKWGGGGLLPGDLGAVLPFVSTGADLGVTRVASMASTWDSSSTGMREVWGGEVFGKLEHWEHPPKKNPREAQFFGLNWGLKGSEINFFCYPS